MTLSPAPSAATAAVSAAPVRVPTVRPATTADDAFIDDLQAIAFGPGVSPRRPIEFANASRSIRA